MSLNLPPRIKVLEAVSAVARGRVKKSDGAFKVRASAGSREYTVILNDAYVYSDDNGTLRRGYVGYPIIAAMIAEGTIRGFPELGEALKDLPWAELNARMASYRKVESYAKGVAKKAGIGGEAVDNYIAEVLAAISARRLKFKDMRQSTLTP
ncbi:MAG: hypothetical protein JRN26_05675 [Nitrososphaerota archaeon]|nr:hypothetical protein [Nitrososphaerota archaeon]MDG6930951.1 hypothetical protein [Nitrososphaerota archaeon]MDG6932933.1 hypothetical protein [Nitrososphaerota archaeon]MDG6936354.1 hypothetical protein [Nitrososphaerota archaeon]MDG6943926.1 hypothetical protein [Nitrososphaerota archaeon]